MNQPATSLWRNPRTWLGLLGLCLLLVAMRAPFLTMPLTTDEGGCAYVAHFWSAEHQLYRDINYDRFQGLFLIYQAIIALFGGDVVGIRMGAALYSCLTLIAVFLFARRLAGPIAGWAGGLLFALFSGAPAIEGFTANAELFAILPLTVSAHCAWQRRWAWAGVLAGLAVLFKPIGVSGWLLVIGWAFLDRAGWRALLAASLGFLCGPGLAAIHGWWIGWEHVWRVFVEQRLLAASVATQHADTQLWRLWRSMQATHVAWLTPALLSLAGLRRGSGRRHLFGVLWLLSSAVGMAIGGQWHWHYWTQLMAPIAVLGGVGAASLVEGGRLTRWGWAVASLLACGWFGVSQGKFWSMSGPEVSWELYHRPEYLVADEIAEEIDRSTNPNDTIYVAFAQADMYYLAKRRSAVPEQFYWLQVARSREVWRAVVGALERREPAMVLWIQMPPEQWSTREQFQELVDTGYHLHKELPFLRLYRRK